MSNVWDWVPVLLEEVADWVRFGTLQTIETAYWIFRRKLDSAMELGDISEHWRCFSWDSHFWVGSVNLPGFGCASSLLGTFARLNLNPGWDSRCLEPSCRVKMLAWLLHRIWTIRRPDTGWLILIDEYIPIFISITPNSYFPLMNTSKYQRSRSCPRSSRFQPIFIWITIKNLLLQKNYYCR